MTSELLEKGKTAVEGELTQYLREIREFPRLTPEEERELARRCAAGDQEAVRKMVNSNLRLVVSVAREYVGRGAPLLDLIQEGSIGLLAAAQKFDYTLDYRFSTYATKWIRQGIGRYLTDHSGLIRVPAHTAERIRKVLRAQSALIQVLGQAPTAEQIADQCGIPADKVLKLLELSPEVWSLDAPVGSEEAGTLGGMLKDKQAPQPQETLVRQELKTLMEELLGMLTERQRQVLRLRFGMEDGICHSLEDIGETLGVSKERARQIERQAMDKLHRLGEDLGLEDFLE